MLKKICKFFSTNYLLIAILSLATFFRLYRIKELMGFWYDQGRDALVIWDFIHKGKLFLIGPMMADSGIFRGPWYYWLITPFYWLGRGNPLWPTVFLVFTSVVAIFVIYKLGGFKAALIASVSMYVVEASRWLADPTPTFLVSVLIVWASYKFIEKKVWALPLIGFLIGMALNFSAATEVFYIPAFLIFFYIERKNLPNLRVILLSVAFFLFAFAPQALFEVRHPGVQSGALYQFIFKENSFTPFFWDIAKERFIFYYNLFSSKFWLNGGLIFAPFFIYFVGTLVFNWKRLWKDDKFKIIFILSVAPIIGTLFFVGSKGNIYEYYFTGYYLIWILLFTKVAINKFIVFFFLATCLVMNFTGLRQQTNAIKLTDQIRAVDWVYQDSDSKNFNVDVYVPPVIPYAYQYLFQWLGTEKYQRLPLDKNIPLLYTLYEVDPGHPERLKAWLDRQKGIGKIEESESFGEITVERRTRIK